MRRGKAQFLSGCNSHPATVTPAGSNRSRRGGNEASKASDVEGPKGSGEHAGRNESER